MGQKKETNGIMDASLHKISSINHKNGSKVESYQYNDLSEIFQHLVEHRTINIIPLKQGSKKPKVPRWKSFQTRQYPLDAIKRHRGNFGVITGQNGKRWSNLVVLDIDDMEGPEGLYKHFKEIDTLHVKTASKGYHIYFWSKTPVTETNNLGKVFNLKIELRGKRGNYCVLPPSHVYYPKEDNWGSHELIKVGEKNPIMEVESPEEFIKKILVDAGYQATEKPLRDTTVELTGPGIVRDGTWIRTLDDDEINELVEQLNPLYKEGQRQNLVLYLSGWMYKAEIDPASALEVVKKLTKDDSEQPQRLTALKNSYRGVNDNLKGASGVNELIKEHYSVKNLENQDKNDSKAQIKKISSAYYRKLSQIIVHPHSILGIQSNLAVIKSGGKGISRAIKKIHQFLKDRYSIIKDSISGELAIYNNELGYYQYYNDDKFQEFLSNVFQDEIFTMDESRKLKSIFARTREQSKNYIVFENGLLNLETLELEEFTPDHFLTFQVPYSWNPEAEGNYVRKKLQEILIDQQGDEKGNIDKYENYLEIVGYMFHEGNPRQKLFLIIGPGGSGKTQLINLISGMFKGGVSSVSLQQFDPRNRFGLQALIGKRVNTLFDISEAEINDPSVIKAVTGNDSITIDRKFKEAITFERGLPVKTIGAGNLLPKIKDDTGALYRRLNITQVKNNFSEDKENRVEELAQKLLEDREGMEWLLYTSLTKYHYLKMENKSFTLDFSPQDVEMEYLKIADPCKYAMKELYEFSNDESDFYTSTEIITTINKFLAVQGLRIPKDTRHNHHPAIREIGGEKAQRRINHDLAWGYTLIKPKKDVEDPKKTRLDKETLISLKTPEFRAIMENASHDEKNLIDLMRGTGPYNLTSIVIGAMQEYGIEKKQVMRVLENWKRQEVLKIDNTMYGG